MYTQLSKSGLREGAGVATAKISADGKTVLSAHLTKIRATLKTIAQKAGVATSTLANAVHGKNISADKARAIAAALGEKTDALSEIAASLFYYSGGKLSRGSGINFYVEFASMAEYEAAIGLTYEPLTLTRVEDNPTVV